MTGGGSPLLADLLTVPGASNTVLEVSVPYAEQALHELLGSAAGASCIRTNWPRPGHARLSTRAALGADHAFGLGVTASLSSSSAKRGQTRAYWAIQTATQSASYQLMLDNADSRAKQEQQLNQALWQSIEHSLLGAQLPSSQAQLSQLTAPESWQPLLHQTPYATCTQNHDGKLILPGSFNPLHQGHQQMLHVAESVTGLTGAYEMTLRNADKPDLDYLTVRERLDGLKVSPVWLTNLTNFEQKAERFSGRYFALGTDTLARIAQPRFYADDNNRMLQAIDNIVQHNIAFLVFGRLNGADFIELADLSLPANLESICQAVASEVYRNDISSSAIRASQRENTSPFEWVVA